MTSGAQYTSILVTSPSIVDGEFCGSASAAGAGVGGEDARAHLDTLTLICNLGLSLLDVGGVDAALRMLLKCLNSRYKVRGDQHPDTIAVAKFLMRFERESEYGGTRWQEPELQPACFPAESLTLLGTLIVRSVISTRCLETPLERIGPPLSPSVYQRIGSFQRKFSPSSVQLKDEISGGFPRMRHQKRHLDFCTPCLLSRGSGVRVSPGAPLSLGPARRHG